MSEFISDMKNEQSDNNKNLNNRKEKNAKKNYFYNMIYQVFALIVPLVVTPYVSRVLGSDGVGQYSFSYSIISYFVLLGAFGFGYYAQREIARFQNDKYNQTKVFWGILFCRAITVIISIIINLLFIIFKLYGDYNLLMSILMINIIATMFDITYLYQGNEEFGLIALRNIIIKIIGIIGVFIFVKDQDDLWIYTLLNSLILIGSNLSLWTRLPKMLVRVKIKDIEIRKHFFPSLRLFIPTIAVSVYTMLDRTLIGLLVDGETTKVLADGTIKIVKESDVQNGYYEQSEKIVKMALTVLTSLGTVMIPKNSFYFKSGNIEKVKDNIYVALKFVMFLGVPIMFGLMAVAYNFSPWFFGEGYEEVPKIIMIFSPLILTIGFNNVFGIQYLLPAGKDNFYAVSVLVGACANLGLNLIFIPIYGALGAAVSSVIAETIILIIQMIYLRNVFSYKKLIFPLLKYLTVGFLMFSVIFIISKEFLNSSIINTLLLVFGGISIYFVALLIIRDKILLNTLSKSFARIKKIIKK